MLQLPTEIRNIILAFGVHHRDRFKGCLDTIRTTRSTCIDCSEETNIQRQCVDCTNTLCEACYYDCTSCGAFLCETCVPSCGSKFWKCQGCRPVI